MNFVLISSVVSFIGVIFFLNFITAYAPVRDYLGAGPDAPFYMKFLAGALTGGVGSVVGNPFDVLKVRMNRF
jgi:hypothetical protein